MRSRAIWAELMTVGLCAACDSSVAIVADPPQVQLSAVAGSDATSATVRLRASDDSRHNVQVPVPADAPWISIRPAAVELPATIELVANPLGISFAQHETDIEAAAGGLDSAVIKVSFALTMPTPCGFVDCDALVPPLPFVVDFSRDAGGIVDHQGIGTGFTFLHANDAASYMAGYVPENLTVDLDREVLFIDTTSGVAYLEKNSATNALGIGLDATGAIELWARLLDVPQGTHGFEQAGLWWGIDEDNYEKIAVISDEVETRVEHVQEVLGERTDLHRVPAEDSVSQSLELWMIIDPVAKTAQGRFAVNGQTPIDLPAYELLEPLVLVPQAIGDMPTGGLHFGGIFATHRDGFPLRYTFDEVRIQSVP